MTRAAANVQAKEQEVAEEAALSLYPNGPAAGGVPKPEEGFAGPRARPMRGIEFDAFVEEVAVQVELALSYVGLDERYAAVHEASDVLDGLCGDFAPGCLPESDRSISFRDEDDGQLPVYVSCGADGVILVCVAHGGEDGEEADVRFVSPPRTLADAAALVRDVVQAIEREIPKPTFH